MEQPHVVIFPYDAQGHVTPAFALGLALARRGVRVTGLLTATRHSHSSTSNTHLQDACPLFRVHAIPDDQLDAGGLHQDDVCFQFSLQKLEPALEQLLKAMRPQPSCLVSDILYPWSQDVADRLGIPRFVFCAFPAIVFLLSLYADTLNSKGFLPFQPGKEDEVIDCIEGLPNDFRLADVPVDFLSRDRKNMEVLFCIQRGLKRAAGTVINTVYELETRAMDTLAKEGWTVYAIGPMGSMDWKESSDQMPPLFAEDNGCQEWLDKQPRGSVVYIAFGSLVSVTEEEIQEVAMGLEACGQPFLWVLRDTGGNGMADPMSALPAGFQERTKKRGLVIGWAPQAAVLAHASVGCFLTHCGMGSVLDALWAGVPMIGGFCKLSEQNTNLRMVTQEWRVGIALQDRNLMQPLALRCAIEKSVEEVLQGENGRALAQNASRLKAVVRQAVKTEGSSYVSLSKLINVLNSVSNGSVLENSVSCRAGSC